MQPAKSRPQIPAQRNPPRGNRRDAIAAAVATVYALAEGADDLSAVVNVNGGSQRGACGELDGPDLA